MMKFTNAYPTLQPSFSQAKTKNQSTGNQRQSYAAPPKPRTVLEIHPEIKEVNLPRAHLINKRKEILVAHLVWDILDHDRRAHVDAVLDERQVDLILLADG